MHHRDRIAALLLIAMLTLPMAWMTVPKVMAAETVATDKSIYVIRWGVTANPPYTPFPYVNITITMNGLVPNDLYRLDIYRWASAAVGYENTPVRYVTTAGPAVPGPITAIIQLMPGTGQDTSYLAGTYYATLTDQTTGKVIYGPGGTVGGSIWFGIWGLSSQTYNFCDNIVAFGGGFNQTADSTVTLTDNLTLTTYPVFDLNLDGTPDSIAVDQYGVFSATGNHLASTNATVGLWYNVNLTSFAALTLGTYETMAEFNVTNVLDVSVWTDLAEYQRTETMTIYAQVTKKSGQPDTDAIISAEIWNQTYAQARVVFARWTNNLNATAMTGSNWTMTATPGIYSATYKIQKNDEIGWNITAGTVWNISVTVTDACGNTGNLVTWTAVKPAVLAKVIWIQPVLSIAKSDTAFMVFNVTYPDGSAVDLNLTASRVLVLKPDGTNTTATVTWVAAGEYNATYFIPPTDPNGTYRFLIQANALVDTVNETWWPGGGVTDYGNSAWASGKPTPPNTGPATDNYSDYFVVGPFALLVVVSTDKPAYAKGETVLITATARYADGSYMAATNVPNWYTYTGRVVAGSKVWVDIYFPDGTFDRRINLVFTPPTPLLPPRWTSTYPTNETFPSGVYFVNCTADDSKGNIGAASTTFLLAGLMLSPSRGTVPPDWSPYLSYDATTGLVSAQVYWAGTRSLGTEVVASAAANTLPANTTFILTIEAVDIPAATKTWYSTPANLNISATDLANKGIQLAIVTTATDGSFSTSFVFPSMPNGTYTILAIKNNTGIPWTRTKALASNDFTVDPGVIIAPNNGTSAFTTGNTLCSVVATGYPVDAIWSAPSVTQASIAALESANLGVASWTTADKYSGIYSAKLSLPSPRLSTDGAIVKIPYNAAIDTLVTTQGVVGGQTVVANLGFWYKNPASALYPYMVLDIDYDGNGVVDNWLVNAWSTPKVTGTWTRAYPTEADPTTGQGGWVGVGPNLPAILAGYQNLSAWKANLPGRKVLNIKVDYGFSAGVQTNLLVYVDDMIINGVTYPLEDSSATAQSLQLMTTVLINGTDALVPYTLQSWAYWIGTSVLGSTRNIPNPIEWRFDGTATMSQAFIAKPAFVLPVLQPGVYEIGVLVVKVNQTGATQTMTTVATATDWVAVYGVTKDLIDLIAALDAKLVEVNGTIATINTTLGEVQVTVNDVNAKVTAINDTVATIQTDVGTVKTDLASIGAKIDTLSGDVATVKTSVGDIEASLEDLGGKVTAIDGRMATVETSLGTVATDVSAMRASVTALQGSVATMSTTLGSVSSKLDTVASDLTDVKGTVSGLSTATWIAAIGAIAAAVVAVIAVVQITRKVYMPK